LSAKRSSTVLALKSSAILVAKVFSCSNISF
jgi:hypothetical protein